MKFAGIIEPGVASGVVTYGKYVQGGYVVAQTIAERNSIPEGVLVDGMPCYVSEMRLLYRYNGKTKQWSLEVGFDPSTLTDENTLTVKTRIDDSGKEIKYLAVSVPSLLSKKEGNGLTVDMDGLYIQVATEVKEGDHRPVSGGAVYTYIADTLGDIQDILEDI